MKSDLISGTGAVSYALKLARAEVIVNNPMSCNNIAKIDFPCEVFDAESPSSAVSYAVASELLEKRTFLTEISDASLLSFMRLPVVSASFNNILSLRDSGTILFLPESNQEILDSVIQAYRLCEDNKVMLPASINMDLPRLRENVSLFTEQSVDKFLPKLKLHNKIDIKHPLSFGVYDCDSDFMVQMQKAMENAKNLIEKLGETWSKKFRRPFSCLEEYMTEDAEFVFVVYGSNSMTCKAVVNRLREQGEKVGVLRIRIARPWPDVKLDAKKVAVIDDISLGSSGILYTELRKNYSGFCSDYISYGQMNEKDFEQIFERLKKGDKEERVWL